MSKESKLGKKLLKTKAFWIILALVFAILLGVIVKYLVVDNSNVLTTEEKLIKEQLDCTNDEAVKVTSQIKEVFDIQIKSATLYDDYLVFNKTEDGEFKAYLVKDDNGLWNADIVIYTGGEELDESVRVKETSDTLFNDSELTEDTEETSESKVESGIFNGLENNTAIIIKGSIHRVYDYGDELADKLANFSEGDTIKFEADYFEDGNAKIIKIIDDTMSNSENTEVEDNISEDTE